MRFLPLSPTPVSATSALPSSFPCSPAAAGIYGYIPCVFCTGSWQYLEAAPQFVETKGQILQVTANLQRQHNLPRAKIFSIVEEVLRMLGDKSSELCRQEPQPLESNASSYANSLPLTVLLNLCFMLAALDLFPLLLSGGEPLACHAPSQQSWTSSPQHTAKQTQPDSVLCRPRSSKTIF